MSSAADHAHRFVLIVEQDGHRRRMPIPVADRLVVGSGDAETHGVDLYIDHPTVSRRHAELRPTAAGFVLRDLDSSNGTVVDGIRLESESVRDVDSGSLLHVGSVACRLACVSAGDAVAAIDLRGEGANAEVDASDAAPGRRATLSVGSVRDFLAHALPTIVSCLEAQRAQVRDEASRDDGLAAVQATGSAIAQAFPCRSLDIVRRHGDGEAVLFHLAEDRSVESDPANEDAPVEIVADPLRARLCLTPGLHVEGVGAVIGLALRLAALAQPRDRAPRGAQQGPKVQPPAMPSPASIDRAMIRLYAEAARMARGDLSILIEGETGTGKEVLARYVHRASARKDVAWTALNCAALPQDLLESELFGIEKGVATGVEARPGRFEQANEGTLFLDEIGDMAAETQAKILRILEEGEVYRLGGRRPRPANVRVIAATNRDLEALVEDGVFRADLFHRITDCQLRLPPLRARLADIPGLASHFLVRAGRDARVDVAGISQAALDILLGHAWPGNVRQLEREMARAALLLEDGELLQTRHLRLSGTPSAAMSPQPGMTMKAQLDSFERRVLLDALARHKGVVRAVAEDLDMSRTTLYRRLGELGIEI